MNRVELLASATDAVNRRPKAYGPPEQNFNRIAARWRVHLKNRFDMDVPVDAVSVAAMCADLKLARIEETPDHEDSWVDLAGYAACGAEVATAAPPAVKVLKVGAMVRFVKALRSKPYPSLLGREGVVREYKSDHDFPWLVQYFGWSDGHRGHGEVFLSRENDCWWCHPDELELV